MDRRFRDARRRTTCSSRLPQNLRPQRTPNKSLPTKKVFRFFLIKICATSTGLLSNLFFKVCSIDHLITRRQHSVYCTSSNKSLACLSNSWCNGGVGNNLLLPHPNIVGLIPSCCIFHFGIGIFIMHLPRRLLTQNSFVLAKTTKIESVFLVGATM